MTALLHRPLVRAALIAASISLTAAHAPAFATPDFPVVVDTCPMQGRDPSAAMMRSSCGVWSPDDFASTPSWDFLELMAVDSSSRGGAVVATLECMSRATGAVSVVAVVRSKASAVSPKKTAVRLPAPLNTRACGYALRVNVNTSNGAAQALMVVLRD